MRRIVVLLALLLVTPAQAGVDGGASGPPLAVLGPLGSWTYTVDALGVAFDLPVDVPGAVPGDAAGDARTSGPVDERAFPKDGPLNEIRHTVRIDRGAIRIDAWQAFHGASLETWFEANLGFLVDERAVVESLRLPAGMRAIVVAQPRTEQTYARKTVVTEVGPWVLAVTCEGLDAEPAYDALCAHVMNTLRPLTGAPDGAAKPAEVTP